MEIMENIIFWLSKNEEMTEIQLIRMIPSLISDRKPLDGLVKSKKIQRVINKNGIVCYRMR